MLDELFVTVHHAERGGTIDTARPLFVTADQPLCRKVAGLVADELTQREKSREDAWPEREEGDEG